MSAPIYFFPATRRDDVVAGDVLRPSFLAAHQLDQVLDGVASVHEGCFCQDLTAKGPGGSSGVLLCVFPPDGAAPKRLGFFPEFQQWLPCSDDRGIWLGFDREEPPRPRDLVRQGGRKGLDGEPGAPHTGYVMQLADGQRWQIPIIRRPPIVMQHGHDLTDLPRDIGWNLEGKFEKSIKPAFQQIWDDAAQVADLFFNVDGSIKGGRFELSVEESLLWTLRGLGLNYRLGRFEQNRLHVVDGTNVFAILGAFVDYPLVNDLVGTRQKKTA